MIFLSVGTHNQQFNRLLEEVDALIEKNQIKEEVFAQTGNSTYSPKHFKYKKFMDLDEFDKCIKQCTLFITHAGEGNIGTGLQYEKKMIVVPRLKKYGEHTNDHQLELANAINKEKQAIVCTPEEIKNALTKIKNLKPKKTKHAKEIINLIEQFEETNFK